MTTFMSDDELHDILEPVSDDDVHDILDVALDVLQDYGGTPGDTRIERMARWIVFNLGVELQDTREGNQSRIVTSTDGGVVRQVGEFVVVERDGLVWTPCDAEGARELATALLIAAPRADVL